MADVLYFTVGNHVGVTTLYELWKYDGVTVSHVWDLSIVGAYFYDTAITCLKYSTTTNKLYIHVDDWQNVDANGNNQGSIYELDPATDVVTLIVTYNFTVSLGDGSQMCLFAFEDNGFIYWVQQGLQFDEHITKFDPVAGTVTLVTPITQMTSVGPFFGNTGSGFLAKVGAYYYWADDHTLRRTTTPDVAGSWTTFYEGLTGPTVELINGGAFLGSNYYFVGVREWGTDGRGFVYNLALSVYKLDPSGGITLVFQDDEQGQTHPPDNFYLQGWQPAQIVNYNGKLFIYNDGIDSFSYWNGSAFVAQDSSGMALTSTDGVTWSWEVIPYSVWLSKNYQATYGQGAAVLGTDLYLTGHYNDTVGTAGSGVHLIKRDAAGIWTTIQRWPNYQLLNPNHGPDAQIALVGGIFAQGPFGDYDIFATARGMGTIRFARQVGSSVPMLGMPINNVSGYALMATGRGATCIRAARGPGYDFGVPPNPPTGVAGYAAFHTNRGGVSLRSTRYNG